MNEYDYKWFSKGFVWVFIDNYVVIFLEFICRLFVLCEVGIIYIFVFGEDYKMEINESCIVLKMEDNSYLFDVFIDVCG